MSPVPCCWSAFLMHDGCTPTSAAQSEVSCFGSPMPSQFLLIAFLRLTILVDRLSDPALSSARCAAFARSEVGETLIWIAAPQLILCPLAGLDAAPVGRDGWSRSIGFIFISVACLMVAYNLTPIWGSYQFLPSHAAAGARAELCAVGRHLLRHPAPEAPGCADVRRACCRRRGSWAARSARRS